MAQQEWNPQTEENGQDTEGEKLVWASMKIYVCLNSVN